MVSFGGGQDGQLVVGLTCRRHTIASQHTDYKQGCSHVSVVLQLQEELKSFFIGKSRGEQLFHILGIKLIKF